MATGERPAPRQHRSCQPHATNLKVANGTKEAGWIAGEMHGVNGHRAGTHQPCVFRITEGKVQCPYCVANLPLVWRGYVPIWDRDWALRYALINEEYMLSVDAIPVGSQVVVSRAKNPISPLIIREEKHGFRALPDKPPFNKPICTRDICLLLWQNDALNRWYADHDSRNMVADVATIIKAPIVTKEEHSRNPLERLREAEEKHLRQQAEAEENAGEVINRLLKPHKNGKTGFSKPT